jgi:hypothetical protein
MLYVWAIIIGIFLLIVFFILGISAVQTHKRRHALEMRGYRIPGDPNVDPRSADEP